MGPCELVPAELAHGLAAHHQPVLEALLVHVLNRPSAEAGGEQPTSLLAAPADAALLLHGEPTVEVRGFRFGALHSLPSSPYSALIPVSYTHLTLPTKRIV
eukprot:TRINITY_DN3487_c0_g1_i2.p1 TRINITY_DN3487_c0_g1~~TRINITY_DN3487_c0_g1_i2.p1  ORF type:complete len:101 (-),score=14.51 TRINITY_DN3487_c0_g1_i2:107-409(-)